MADISHLQGTITTIIDRLNSQRLPRVSLMKQRVLQGERLDELDIHYLERLVRDMRHVQYLSKNHPRYQSLFVRVIGLYAEVTAAALENERLANQG